MSEFFPLLTRQNSTDLTPFFTSLGANPEQDEDRDWQPRNGDLFYQDGNDGGEHEADKEISVSCVFFIKTSYKLG